jgi:signal transduction histidine kinase
MTNQDRASGGESPIEPRALPSDGGEEYLRTEFLQRLAHDLRGHAGVIHGALQELELTLGEQAATASPFFGMAKRGVKRILRMAERLQQTGQLARGVPALTSADTDLRALVRQAAEDADAIEGRKKIRIELDLPGGQVLSVVDAHWLSSAFCELASNAIRHAQQRVSIVVLAEDPQYVTIAFSDDGRSVGEFGPARFRAPKDRRGLGLGLAIVHDVIAAHGGKIEVAYGRRDGQNGQDGKDGENGQDGFGAKVTVTLPRR